ncbi:uncharacterized protein VTP21DRAFT_4790 [Calcarisporiella thermophila]|uniref:uncharacterized protein n=1 Tax=Calcarisporiella thermophila TaxID=911321 RepID=UPI003744ABE3
MQTSDSHPQHHQVIIVGTGFSGLGAAIRLKQENIHDFIVLDRGNDVGGTWRDNTYPGLTCDIPSDLYSFSYECNPNWSRHYSSQPEILDYLRYCAAKYGVYQHCRFQHNVESMTWDERRNIWVVQTSKSVYTTNVILAGMGQLSEPKYPDIPGLDEFAKSGGKLFHSSRWDHHHNLNNRKVAVFGTGASALQFVPVIQPKVKHMVLFQRTPHWIIPRDNHSRFIQRWLLRLLPFTKVLVRAYIFSFYELLGLFMNYWYKVLQTGQFIPKLLMYWQIKDPEMRKKLTPNYVMGCKRILISNEFYPAVTQPNVTLVTDKVAKIESQQIVMKDGTKHEVDTIIIATGFHVSDHPMARIIRGRDGKLLSDVWKGEASAYKGSCVPGFPNLFIFMGPNTGSGHISYVFLIECQARYAVDAIKKMHSQRLSSIEVTEKAHNSYNELIARKVKGTVQSSGGCSSWYLASTGKNTITFPDFGVVFYWNTRRFDIENYKTVRWSAKSE